MHSSANSDHSPCSSKAKLFHIQFSDLHVSKEDSINPRRDQLECPLFEAEYLADEDSVFMSADVAAIVHPSQKETLRVVNSGNLLGLSKLSLSWIKLGNLHERIQPGKPQQNGRHERMHRTLKVDTTKPPART